MTEASDSGATPPQQRSFAIRIVRDLIWVWAVAALASAVLRIVAHDATLPLYIANSLTLYLYLPSYVVVLIALWRRWWILGAISVFAVACHLVWVLPDFRSSAIARPPAGADPVKVFSANLYMNNPDPRAIIAEIQAAEPDVILLQEYSSRWETDLTEAGIGGDYPYSIRRVRQDSFGTAIYSRTPLVDEEVWYSGEVPMLSATIGSPSGRLRIINWHPLPPASFEYFRVLNKQYADLIARLSDSQIPTIVMGDFNATQHARCMQRLEAIGFRSAHEAVGRGYAWTFPNGTSRVPPIRIDHALMPQGVHCLSIREGRGAGSDHKPLIAEFALDAEAD